MIARTSCSDITERPFLLTLESGVQLGVVLDLDRQNALRERYRQQRPNWQSATTFYAELVRSKLEPASRVLDLGCGRGGLVEQLGHPLNQIIGVDPDVVSLQEHRLVGELPLTAAVSHRLPFPDGRFDLVLASWALEHLADPQRVAAEVGRELKPGGAFIFITSNKRHPLIGFYNLINRFSNFQDELARLFYGRVSADTFPIYYRANTSGDIRKLAVEAGMTLVVSQAIIDPTYLALRPSWFDTAVWFDEKLPSARAIHLVGMIEKGTE
jgi:SAM-dependent methyltransferase